MGCRDGYSNPSLTKARAKLTLPGGTGGTEVKKSVEDASTPRDVPSADAESMRSALDALTTMYCGYLGSDRELLDEGFESLVGILEEWRDAVPKA